MSAQATPVAGESRHGTQPRITRPLATWRPAAFSFTPLVATGLVLFAVDLMTALLAMRRFDRLRAAAPGPDPWSLSDYRPQTLLLVLAAMLAALPLLHLASKVLAHAAWTGRYAWLRAVRVTLCVPASLCPVTVITLLLTTGH